MNTLLDEELLFLCNLMHMRLESVYDKAGCIQCESPFENVWVEKNYGLTIGEIIKNINVRKLRLNHVLRDHNFDGIIAGHEWADMIEAIRASNVRKLQFRKLDFDDKKAMNTYFVDEDGRGYVVFHGTSVGEWLDNFEGGLTSDTEQQKRALAFVEELNDDHLTVVGHSKGGNKAKYVALLSNKVTRCVSYDGQGFSKEFLELYQNEIEKNRYKIRCYALGNDFVNIFMHDIYDTKKYIVGYGIDSFEENHSPNSFYHFYYDFFGHVKAYEFVECEQGSVLKQIQKFCNYIIENPDSEDREKMIMTLGEMVQMILGRKGPDYTDKYSIMEIMYYVKQNTGNFKLFWGYFKAYGKHDMYCKTTDCARPL